jgi:hypothetical protein
MKTACWLYDRVLRLYPRAFYLRFARDMSTDFHDGYAAARRNSRAASLSFTARGYADLAVSLLFQWLATELFVIWRASVLVAVSLWTVAFTVAALEWSGGPADPWFAIQLGIALVAGSTLTVGLALRNHESS